MAIRVTPMPRDTNAHGTVFGGYILSLIDQAGAIAAHKIGGKKLVTVAMHEVTFNAPVFVGDLVTCYARVVKKGRTSVTVCVRVGAASHTDPNAEERDVTQAEVIYVQVDDNFDPLPLP